MEFEACLLDKDCMLPKEKFKSLTERLCNLMMNTKTKGKKVFFWTCLGRAMVALFLSAVSLVVVSLIPRPHLYWSGYKTNLLMWISVAETLQKS